MKTRILFAVLACVAGGSLLSSSADALSFSTVCTKKTGTRFDGVLNCIQGSMTKADKNNPTAHTVADLIVQQAQKDPKWALAALQTECSERNCLNETDKAKSVAGLNNAPVLEAVAQKTGTSIDELTTGQVLQMICPLVFEGYQKTKDFTKAPVELNASCGA